MPVVPCHTEVKSHMLVVVSVFLSSVKANNKLNKLIFFQIPLECFQVVNFQRTAVHRFMLFSGNQKGDTASGLCVKFLF